MHLLIITKCQKWSKQFHIKPHHCHTRIIQPYSQGAINLHPYLICDSLVCKIPQPKFISIGSAIFVGFTVMTNTNTNTHTCMHARTHAHTQTNKTHYMYSNRSHLILCTAMWPNNKTDQHAFRITSSLCQHCLQFIFTRKSTWCIIT